MSMTGLLILAQDAAAAAAPSSPAVPPWWHVLLNQSFPLLILFIFVTAIVTVLVQQRNKDKCLKLMHDYHVSYLSTAGTVRWGNLIVYSKGLELVFASPHRTRHGLVKASALIYDSELGNCLAICRAVDALTSQERRLRHRQIHRSFKPGTIRRVIRWFRNILNTLKDAFSKALSALIGQLSKAKVGAVVTTHRGSVDQIGQSVLGAGGNAYEPILDRHIGKPVVLQLASPADPEQEQIDLPGFLVDYTDKYLAVFNVEHEPTSHEHIELSQSVEKSGYKIDLVDDKVTVTCRGLEILIVKSIQTDRQTLQLGVALANGTSLELRRGGGEKVTLGLELTRRVDIVCPRSHATIHFGSGQADGETDHGPEARREPQLDVQSAQTDGSSTTRDHSANDPLHDR